MRHNKVTKEFLEIVGDFYHLRLLEYLKIYASGEELHNLKDEEIITINYDENPNVKGSYSISYKDLKAEAKKDEKKLKLKYLKNEQQ